jgi:regulatory protein
LNGEAAPDEALGVELTAVKLLASREHSRRELRRKLLARVADAELVDRVLDDLQTRDLLSDRRFAEGYIEQRSRKGYGPLKIRAELSERGIGGELLAECLEHAEPDWSGLLATAAERKFGDTPTADRRELARRGRFLEQRGFPISLVRRYLEHVSVL